MHRHTDIIAHRHKQDGETEHKNRLRLKRLKERAFTKEVMFRFTSTARLFFLFFAVVSCLDLNKFKTDICSEKNSVIQ